MIRKRTILSLALLATTAACGGGGGGGGAAGPAPAASSTPPAQGSTASTNFNNPSVVATTDANGNLMPTMAADPTSQTATIAGDGSADNPATITIKVPGISHTFITSAGQLELTDQTFNGSTPMFNTAGSNLAMFKDGDSGVLVTDNSGQLSFSNYGVWSHTDANNKVTVGAFAAGAETSAADLAALQNSKATYQGSAVGTGSTGGQKFNLAGSFQGQVDFGARTASVNLNMNAINPDGGQTAFNLASGPISMTGSRYAGAIAGNGVSGTTAGAVYGNTAQEMGGVFSVAGGGTTAIGAYGGAQVPATH